LAKPAANRVAYLPGKGCPPQARLRNTSKIRVSSLSENSGQGVNGVVRTAWPPRIAKLSIVAPPIKQPNNNPSFTRPASCPQAKFKAIRSMQAMSRQIAGHSFSFDLYRGTAFPLALYQGTALAVP
jgi:hypothetical protein